MKVKNQIKIILNILKNKKKRIKKLNFAIFIAFIIIK